MIPKERLYIVDNQHVILKENIEGQRILDIGGGGEGVIGLCYQDRVIAIDQRKDELEEAPNGPLKIVMNAKDLLFIDDSFDTATSFFTLMYIERENHRKVLEEVYRVLKPEGCFWIWDTIIPKYEDDNRDIFMVSLKIDTSIKHIETSYGVNRKDKEQDMDYFINLGKEIGFTVVKFKKDDNTFLIVLKK